MSEANKVDISFVKEVEFGVTPGGVKFKILSITGAPDFALIVNTATSEELRSDRQTDDLALVGIEAGGSIEFEYAYKKYDALIAGFFYDEWNELDSYKGSDLTITDGQLTFDDSADKPDALQVGSLVLIEGLNQQEELFVVSALSGGDVTLDGILAESLSSDVEVSVVGFELLSSDVVIGEKSINVDSSAFQSVYDSSSILEGDYIGVVSSDGSNFYRVSAAVDSGSEKEISFDQSAVIKDVKGLPDAANSRIYFSKSIKNGVDRKSYSILQRFGSLPDGENQLLFNGCVPDEFTLNFDTQSIITGTGSFAGLNSKFLATSIPDNMLDQPEDEKLLNTSSNVGSLLVDGVELQGPNFIEAGSISIANNVRRQNAIGSVGSVNALPGRSEVTGQITTFFGDKSLLNDLINSKEKSLTIFLNDGFKRRVVLDFPKIKFESGSVSVEAVDTDLKLPLDFRALRHSELDYQVKIVAFPYLK